MIDAPVAIIGAGPAGMTLALLLARGNVRSILLDARTEDDARSDPRLLALSRGSLQTLATVVDLAPAQLAPIRRVVVSSSGELGRAVLDQSDCGDQALGATIRYGDLLRPLAAQVSATDAIDCRRPWRVAHVRQFPDALELVSDAGALTTAIAVNAEGAGGTDHGDWPGDHAIVADVEVLEVAAGVAHERFTRDGPLALLPTASRPGAAATMALVWCMRADAAMRRRELPSQLFVDELNRALGSRNGRVVSVRDRRAFPLIERVRREVREHRVVHLGNAAQALHPVAGQGLNLGLRDCVALANGIAAAVAAGRDPLSALSHYERERRIDRRAIVALTRAAPPLFTTRFAPVALGRSLALTALAAIPQLRREFARVMMFGVRW